MQQIHAAGPIVARALTVPRFDTDLLLAVGIAALALGFMLARRGYVTMHRRPYVDPSGHRLLHTGAILVGTGIVLGISAIIVRLLF